MFTRKAVKCWTWHWLKRREEKEPAIVSSMFHWLISILQREQAGTVCRAVHTMDIVPALWFKNSNLTTYVPVNLKLQHLPPPPPSFPGIPQAFDSFSYPGRREGSIKSPLIGGGEFEGKDSAFVADWLKSKGLHKEISIPVTCPPCASCHVGPWFSLVLSIKPCLHTQLQKHNRSYWKVKTVIW